ncbi:MAG: 50S ribosomal protein L35 [Chlamydiales bacterium]
MKTHKSSASRFKVTGGGKLLRRHPGKGHKLTKKSSHIKRHLGKAALVPDGMLKMYKRMMGV